VTSPGLLDEVRADRSQPVDNGAFRQRQRSLEGGRWQGENTMKADRYLKVVLTIIALELGWIALKDAAVNVSAQQSQQNQQPMSVIIRGIDLSCPGNTANCRETSLPVSVTRATVPMRVTVDSPLPVDARGIVRIRQDQPVVVETGERPLLIQSVPPTASPRPGIPDQR
jgi:hypothetical protein